MRQARLRDKKLQYRERKLKKQAAEIERLKNLTGQTTLPPEHIAEAIGKAAAYTMQGKNLQEIADLLKVGRSSLTRWQLEWKDHWDAAFGLAAGSLVKIVRAMVGTDEILKDPDKYLAMVMFADKWTSTQGVELFPVPEGVLTLSRFYENWYVPNRLGDAMPRTKESYRTSLRRWRLITGDPPVVDINTVTIARFRDALSKMRGTHRGTAMSPNSIRSYMRHIQTLLDKLGPPIKGNRDGLGILQQPPWAKPPREIQRIPRTIPLEYISACIAAAGVMTVPRFPGVKAPTLWRALLIVAWNTGLRIGSLLSMRMEHIDWDGCRIILPAACTKSRRPQIIHLNPSAMEALLSIRTDRERVFPWPHDPFKKTFHKHFHKLQNAAGIPRKDHFGMHTIRKTVATTMWGMNPGAAVALLGHTTDDVTRKFYVDGGEIVAETLDRLPQPPDFVVLPETADPEGEGSETSGNERSEDEEAA